MTSTLAKHFEATFRTVDREVWIVTAASDDRRGGMVATWVSQASLDNNRPVVVLGAAPNHHTTELIGAAGCFGLHLITEEQADLAWNFGIGSGRDRDKLADLALDPNPHAPLLRRCLARMVCRTFARLPTGDRIYYWADVIECEKLAVGEPLGEQRLIALASDEQKRLLRENREADIAEQSPVQEQWRENIPAMLRPDASSGR